MPSLFTEGRLLCCENCRFQLLFAKNFVMNFVMNDFYTIGGTLPSNAPSYVERGADERLQNLLQKGEFTYVLTARQMGKSSLMVRTSRFLRERQIEVIILDFTAIGQNVSPEQWYDGLLLGVGRQLDLEDDLEKYWRRNLRLSPVQRWFAALYEIVLDKLKGPLVIFCDEIDVVKSLPFRTDEFFAAIRECYHRRIHERKLARLNFCLLGVATPSQLIADPRTTPFNIGRRVQLEDFTAREARPLARGFRANVKGKDHKILLDRVLYWTGGHPYLTQKLCRKVAEKIADRSDFEDYEVCENDEVDEVCEDVFLSVRAREQDDNLLFVREMMLRNRQDLRALLECYARIQKGESPAENEADELCNHLILSGIVRIERGKWVVRNRIYNNVFDHEWVAKVKPVAEIEMPNGNRIRIQHACTIGRSKSNDISLSNPRVSRRHAVIRSQSNGELWMIDLGSRNGVFINGRRIHRPSLLHDRDCIGIGPFQMTFVQSNVQRRERGSQTTMDQTLIA